jgi:hypothetical protein
MQFVSEGTTMRTLAFIGAAAIAATIGASSAAWAWTAEQPAQQGSNAVDLSDPDNFKALQDKVNGNAQFLSGSSSSFYVTGGVGNGLSPVNPYGIAPLGRGSAFSYSPQPGFRGAPE